MVFSNEIYNDLCWIIYGLKGVSLFYLEEEKRWPIIQRRGGTDDIEHDFLHQRNKNSNPII